MERQQRKINGSPLRRSGIGTVRQTDTFPEISQPRWVVGDWLFSTASGDRVTVIGRKFSHDAWWYEIVVYSPSGRPTEMWVPEDCLTDQSP